MRNICMISQSPYPFDPRVRRQAEKLANAGFEVDIFCLPIDNEPGIEKFGEKITAYRILKNNEGQESIRKYLWVSFRFFLFSFIKLQKLNRVRKYKLIQIHNMPEAHVFIAIIQKFKGTPLLLDIHDLTPELLTSKWDNSISRIFKPFAIFFEMISCKLANHVITVTEGCREILAKRSTSLEKVSVVLNTANTSTFPFYKERTFKKIDGNLKLLYHGTVAKRFGLHIVIDAMPQILKKIPNSVLRVFGKYDADYKEYLDNKIDRMGLKESVFLEGVRTHEELYEIMKDSDIEVVPYIGNEYMHLSLSTKVFECAASGLPIVATRLRTLALSFDDSSIKFARDRDSGDFADKIISLCNNPTERAELVSNAYKAINCISGDIMEEKYISLIEKMTGLHRLKNDEFTIENVSTNG